MSRSIVAAVFAIVCQQHLVAQSASVHGTVMANGAALPFATVTLSGTVTGTVADENGMFRIEKIQPGKHELVASFVGYRPAVERVELLPDQSVQVEFALKPSSELQEVVVTGTMKTISRAESPVPIEVLNAPFFRKNPTPNLYDAMQNVNGVRPQINCNVCNTGDIHINGLEGPYTMVLIDGMPIVSGLSTVYGLSGIPNSMIEQVEIVKGPASALYGSEAVGGLINVITKDPAKAPVFSADAFLTSWLELNTDLGFKFNVGKKASVLSGLNYFNYQNPVDNNGDNFTDVTLQERASFFQKWSFSRKEKRLFTLAGRFLTEDRWGGELQWDTENRGGDSIYGESIYTTRWELLGKYQLPFKEKIFTAFSFNSHRQDSYYGQIPYMADQRIAFAQATWDKRIGRHDLLVGTALRYTFYDDNTTATATGLENIPTETWLPGFFVQDEVSLNEFNKLLLGMRYDYNSLHGHIYTPRIGYKWTINYKNILRVNAGTGYRVVNLFTEEHAALTGSREVVVMEHLDPEQSYNVNLNYVRKFYFDKGHYISLDASSWYTHFTNQILPDYDTDPNKIIYDNLNGHAVTRGFALNADLSFNNGWKILAGATYMDVYTINTGASGNKTKTRPVLTEEWTGVFTVSYFLKKLNLSIDYTGNVYGPMRLPLLGPLDPRAGFSPWWSIQNIQVTYAGPGGQWELYGGVKNLLNFTPPANSIARAHDPFDKRVVFGPDGNPLPTAENPYVLTFDPSYVFAPNQGIRAFLGFRWNVPAK